jgi:nucleoside-diphosphate-sugar epimerase
MKSVIVFGSTGAIGTSLIDIMSKQQPTWSIYAVTRSDPTQQQIKDKFGQYPNVQIIQGDPIDHSSVVQLCKGKDLVYSTIGFTKYEAKYWAETWPVVIDNLLDGSSQHPNQKFVFCDNLYAYGPGTNISTKSELVKPTPKTKPGVRSMIRPKLQHRIDTDQQHPVSIVGGADFFGPGVTSTSFLGNLFTRPIVEDKTTKPICIGSSSKIHDFCYSRDFANALYIAGIDERADGKFWICPHTIHNKSIQDIANDIARLAGSSNKKVTVYPGWIVRIVSLFDTFLREMIEMLPFWSNDYTIDDSEFCDTFNVQPTPYEEALQANVDFFRAEIATEQAQNK